MNSIANRKKLEPKCERLARVLGVTFGEYGKAGSLLLDGANGGYSLEQVCENGIGVTSLSNRYVPAEMSKILDAMIKGAELAKGIK